MPGSAVGVGSVAGADGIGTAPREAITAEAAAVGSVTLVWTTTGLLGDADVWEVQAMAIDLRVSRNRADETRCARDPVRVPRTTR